MDKRFDPITGKPAKQNKNKMKQPSKSNGKS
jgi:hypothetical protein